MHVRAILLEYPTPVSVVECLQAGACDAGFLALLPRTAEAGEFSEAFIQFDYTLLVPTASSIRTISDVDRPGVRIAAVHDHASTLALSKLLKQAEVIYGEAPDSAFELLKNGKAAALASTRPALIEYSVRLPGSRVLEQHYGSTLHRIVVPKGNTGRLAYINEFILEAKTSGWLQKVIDLHGPQGIHVVAPARSN